MFNRCFNLKVFCLIRRRQTYRYINFNTFVGVTQCDQIGLYERLWGQNFLPNIRQLLGPVVFEKM